MRFLPLFTAVTAALTPWLPAGTPAYRTVILADNPIAYWEMDEGLGATTAADSAVTAHPGTYENVVLGQTSAFSNLGTCGQFNGTSRVQVPPNNVFNLGTGDFTVETWAKTPIATRGDVFNYKNSTDFGIFLNQAASGSIGGYLNGFLPSYTATINAWYHIVITRSASTARLYVNGVERGTAAATSSFSANAPIFIGTNHNGAAGGYTMAFPFNGWIDEVAVYSTALSAVRVLDHYNAAQAAPTGSPTVTNSAATTITSTGARLGGTVTDPGTSTPTVTIYYGDNDGGSSLVGWDSTISGGPADRSLHRGCERPHRQHAVLLPLLCPERRGLELGVAFPDLHHPRRPGGDRERGRHQYRRDLRYGRRYRDYYRRQAPRMSLFSTAPAMPGPRLLPGRAACLSARRRGR